MIPVPVDCCAPDRANNLELTLALAKADLADVGSAGIWLLTNESIVASKEFQKKWDIRGSRTDGVQTGKCNNNG
jgi:hypothetical protein